MRYSKIPRIEYVKMAELFDWFTREQAVAWFTGGERRHKRTETLLPALVTEGKLRAVTYEKRLVYTHPRNGRGGETKEGHIKSYSRIPHGLGVTECLVRFWRSDMDSMIVPEQHFKGCGVRPDIGFKFDSGKLMCIEFTTEHNWYKKGNISGKLRRYRKYSDNIEERFQAEFFVVFVADIRRDKIGWFIERADTSGPFLFVDLETFKSVPHGHQLTAPIYIWGEDGKDYGLKAND